MNQKSILVDHAGQFAHPHGAGHTVTLTQASDLDRGRQRVEGLADSLWSSDPLSKDLQL